MDMVGRFHLAEGAEVSVVTGIDDHSRFCVCTRLVLRATARPVCDALAHAMRTHGVPDQILTDNGKVFTTRFGKGPRPVLFDRICTDNGIRHLLTAPYSPTTTGKVERFHKTLRAGFLGPNDYRFATLDAAQDGLDAWVDHYNTERPHQSLGMAPPLARLRLGEDPHEVVEAEREPVEAPARGRIRAPGVVRWVDGKGHISLAGFAYRIGRVFTGEPVEAVCDGGLPRAVTQERRCAPSRPTRRRRGTGAPGAGRRRDDAGAGQASNGPRSPGFEPVGEGASERGGAAVVPRHGLAHCAGSWGLWTLVTCARASSIHCPASASPTRSSSQRSSASPSPRRSPKRAA